MISEVQTRLSAFERALDTLIDSITIYNPSVSAAKALIAIDEDLYRDFEALAQQYKNFERIQRLRQTTETLQQQIRDGFKARLDLRKELVASRPELEDTSSSAQAIDDDQLIALAQRIARFTNRPKDLPEVNTEPQVETEHDTGSNRGQPGNTQDRADESGDAVADRSGSPTDRALDKLPPYVKAWINQPQNADGQPIWTPWPNENVIKSGALGLVQKMIEENQDPGVVVNVNEAAMGTVELKATQAAEEPRNDASVNPEEPATNRDERKRLQEQEREKQAATFDEFDLYDPDAD